MGENLNPTAIRRLLKELKELQTHPLEGIKILQEDTVSTIEAIIMGPSGTPFEGGNFRVRISFGADYPQSPPGGTFLTKIFHPNVSPKGEICVNTLKKDWESNLPISHIFLVIRCLLIHPNPESALNEEAGKLILEDFQEFEKRAKMWTDIHAKERKECEEKKAEKPTKKVIEKKKEEQKKKKTLKRL